MNTAGAERAAAIAKTTRWLQRQEQREPREVDTRTAYEMFIDYLQQECDEAGWTLIWDPEGQERLRISRGDRVFIIQTEYSSSTIHSGLFMRQCRGEEQLITALEKGMDADFPEVSEASVTEDETDDQMERLSAVGVRHGWYGELSADDFNKVKFGKVEDGRSWITTVKWSEKENGRYTVGGAIGYAVASFEVVSDLLKLYGAQGVNGDNLEEEVVA